MKTSDTGHIHEDLCFSAAKIVALTLGFIQPGEENMASISHSHLTEFSYVLADENGHELARVPLSDVLDNINISRRDKQPRKHHKTAGHAGTRKQHKTARCLGIAYYAYTSLIFIGLLPEPFFDLVIELNFIWLAYFALSVLCVISLVPPSTSHRMAELRIQILRTDIALKLSLYALWCLLVSAFSGFVRFLPLVEVFLHYLPLFIVYIVPPIALAHYFAYHFHRHRTEECFTSN